MEKLYTVNKKQDWDLTVSRSWAPYCKIQTYIEEIKEKH